MVVLAVIYGYVQKLHGVEISRKVVIIEPFAFRGYALRMLVVDYQSRDIGLSSLKVFFFFFFLTAWLLSLKLRWPAINLCQATLLLSEDFDYITTDVKNLAKYGPPPKIVQTLSSYRQSYYCPLGYASAQFCGWAPTLPIFWWLIKVDAFLFFSPPSPPK